jgi:integrase
VDKARAQITLTFTKTSRRRVVEWRTPGGDATPLLADAPRAGRLLKNYPNFSSNVGQVMRRIERQEREHGRAYRRFRVRDLRHWFAVRWLKKGGDIYCLQNHLGHTSVKTTEVYLDHLTEQEQGVAQKGTQSPQNAAEDGAREPRRGGLEDADM